VGKKKGTVTVAKGEGGKKSLYKKGRRGFSEQKGMCTAFSGTAATGGKGWKKMDCRGGDANSSRKNHPPAPTRKKRGPAGKKEKRQDALVIARHVAAPLSKKTFPNTEKRGL